MPSPNSEEDASVMSVENENEDLTPPYLPDQKVLCRDVNNDKHFYAATVKKVKAISNSGWSFYIHYSGWNSRWDHWTNEGNLLEDTPENRKSHLKAKEVAASAAASKKRKHMESQQSRRRKSSEQKEVWFYEEFCELPFTLHTVLVDEYEEITRKGFDNPRYYDVDRGPRPARNVHKLPPAVTVRQVLQQYQRKRGGSNADQTKQDQALKFCDGLCLLFDGALQVCLLYPEEQPQYEALQNKEAFQNKRNCEIYGCVHLLRLVVRLPMLLQAESKSEMETMAPMIADLIVLLQKNRQACFKNSYREPRYEELLDWEKVLADNKKSADSNPSKK
jgi:hypothetical protein